VSTGSWSYDHTFATSSGRRYGRIGSKSWNGGDDSSAARAKLQLAKPVYRVVYRANLLPTRIFDDSVFKDMPPKRASHEEHNYTMEVHTLWDTKCVWPTTGATDALIQATVGIASPSSQLNANDQIKLVQKLKEKHQGSDFNLSVFLGEGHQTLKLLADSAIRVAKGLHHLRKGNLAGAARALLEGTGRKPISPYHGWNKGKGSFIDVNASSLAKNWLELQYGWLPLLEDAKGAAELLAHRLNVPLQQSYRVSVKREVRGIQGPLNIAPGINLTGTWVKRSRRSLIARISERPTIPKLLGVLDPAQVAWELLPFSFVADWFIPIGSWIEARGYAQGLSGVFITTNKDEMECFAAPGWPGADYRSLKQHWIKLNRTISNDLDVPLPAVKPLGKALSWMHCANALALVTSFATGMSVRNIR
jgi:hypothetical protein